MLSYYTGLLNIFHGFTVVKNSREGVRTIFSIGLWKKYSQIKQTDVKDERFWGTIFDLVPAYPESFNLVSFNFDSEYILSCFIPH